jgi:tetratricopeptide (TPR) repeat protein
MDNRNADAYKGVGVIHLKQKLYAQAKETFEYLVKSKRADDLVYASLAEIAEAEGEWGTAERMRLKAVELRPRLSNRHAELARFYAERGQHAKAWPHAKTAVELEPKSAKYQELALECAADLTAPLNVPLLEQAVGNLIDNAVKYSDAGTRVRVLTAFLSAR